MKTIKIGEKINYLNENEQLIKCTITEIKGNEIYLKDKKGNVYVELLQNIDNDNNEIKFYNQCVGCRYIHDRESNNLTNCLICPFNE